MMKTDTFSQQPGNRFEFGKQQLIDSLNRSESLKQFALLGVHIAGCMLILAAPLLFAAAGGSAYYFYTHINGPLDWFFVEMFTTLSLFGAYLSWQLSALRPAASDGVAISESQAPEFYAMLDRRAGHFNVKNIRNISLSTQATLDVVATPLLPLPFWHRYTLRTGAPLLFFLSHRQFRLALAGTIAASVAEKSALNRWLAQACNDWPLILKTLEARPCLLSRLLQKPMRHVVHAANSLGHDLQTDWREQQGQWVRENSDEQNLIDYLANQVVADAFFERQYWPMILKAAERSPTPVVKAFSHLPLLLEKTLNQTQAERWLLRAQTTSSNEHNNLRDLLASLQIEHLHWPGLPEQNAFSVLFTSNAALKQLDTHWQGEIEQEWRERHNKFKADRARFERLQQRAAEQALRGQSALRFIKLAERFVDKKEAMAIYRRTLETNKDDAKVCFTGGLALLRAGAGNAGVTALQRAASLEPLLAKRAQALINEHKNAWLSDSEPAADDRSVHKAIA